MVWTIEFDKGVEKDLKKLNKDLQKRIMNYLQQRVISGNDPKKTGKPLRGSLFGLWRYRVGDHRILCHINDIKRSICIVAINHRKKFYSL